MSRHWVNGVADAAVPPDDRGLLYGDGVFRTGLVWEGRLHAQDQHLQVLRQDAAALGLDIDLSRLESEILQATAGVARGRLRLTLTRQQDDRGYRPQWPASCRRIITVGGLPERPPHCWQDGVAVALLSEPAPELTGPLAAHKHLNRLPQVWAQRWLRPDSGLQEILRTNRAGLLIGGSMSTLFLRQSETGWVTPGATEGALQGVSLRSVSSLMQQKAIPLRYGPVTPEALIASEEAFVANALVGLWPLRSLCLCRAGGESGPVIRQWGAPGEHTLALMHEFRHPLLQSMLTSGRDTT